MKIVSALALAAGIAMSANAMAGTVTLINGTSSEISEINVSSSGTNDWEENIIEGSVLPSGNQVDIQLPAYNEFDLRIASSDGGEEEYYNFPGNCTQITLKGAGNSEYQ